MANYQKAILDLRAKLNISQTELAKKLGVAFASVNRWENGVRPPSKLHLQQLINILKENDIKVED